MFVESPEWFTAGTEVMLGIGPLAIGLISSIAPVVAGKLLGGGGGGGGGSLEQELARRNLNKQSGVETDILENKRDIMDRLIALAGTYKGGPIGQLDLPDSPFLDEAALGALEPRRDIDLLQSLLNVGIGSGATSAAASLGQRQSELDAGRRAQTGENVANIVDDIITLISNKRDGGALIDVPDPSSSILNSTIFHPPSTSEFTLDGL